MSYSPAKVSVVMSVYNDSCYLKESVESILNQSFTDFEFILIDDGSTDDSWDILTHYSRSDRRIKVVKNEQNIGLTKSLNKGLELAQGEYIARQDSDDISLPERLRLQTEFLDSHIDVGAIGTGAKIIDEKGQILGFRHVDTDHERLKVFLLINNNFLHSSLMARQQLVKQIGGYNENLRYAQDYALWWDISEIARLGNLPEPLILLRTSTNNITSKKRLEQLSCAYKISFKAVTDSLKGKFLDEPSYQRFWWATLLVLDRSAYQQYWFSQQNSRTSFHSKDVQNLDPFWDLLASMPASSQVLGGKFKDLAIELMRDRQTEEGLKLLWVIATKLNIPIPGMTICKALLKPFLPKFVHRFKNPAKQDKTYS